MCIRDRYEATNILPTKEKVKIELPKGKIMQKQAFEKLQKKKIEELQDVYKRQVQETSWNSTIFVVARNASSMT